MQCVVSRKMKFSLATAYTVFCQKIKKQPFSADPPTFPPTAAITRRKEPLEGRCCITNDQNAWACETIPVVLHSGLSITIVQKCLLNRPFCLPPTHAFYNDPPQDFFIVNLKYPSNNIGSNYVCARSNFKVDCSFSPILFRQVYKIV